MGVRLRPARPGGHRLDTRIDRPPHGRAPRGPAGVDRAGQPRPHRSRDRGRRSRGRGRRAPLRAGHRRLATGPADPAERDADHRPARRRGRPVGRAPQEVAPVRQQGADRRRDRRGCGWRSSPRVLPDLSRDGGPGGLPDPCRIGVPRRVGRLLAERQCPAAVRPGCRRRAAGDAPAGSLRTTRRRAVRRDDRRRRRFAGQLPAQVGGDPLIAGGWCHELRPVGAGDRRDRPFQDRVRWARGPVRRGMGPRPEPRRSSPPTTSPSVAGSGWPGGVAGSPPPGAPRPTGPPIERPGRHDRGACGLGCPSR